MACVGINRAHASLSCPPRRQGGAVVPCARVPVSQNSGRLRTVLRNAYVGRWPDPQFIQETKDQYLGQGIYGKPLANAEEARVLLSCDYMWLDIRSDVEVDQGSGRVPGSVHVPYYKASRKYDPEQKKSIVTTTVNESFIKQVEMRFPDKEKALLIVADFNGKSGAEEALTLLEEAHYENLVGMVGGFNAFRHVFDAKLNRRAARGAFREDPMAPGDAQSIFAGES